MDAARAAEERAQAAMDELNAAVARAAEDADNERRLAETAASEKAGPSASRSRRSYAGSTS